ncbi:hypothetical protein [Filifactor villosus]|uniref:Uncharacterized protein n=1 Tax=Filifactor villosus TaxID=29374 RepID=A0ABV9QSU8_9FIRM
MKIALPTKMQNFAKNIARLQFETMGKDQILMNVLSTFLVSNIPTIVLLTLYFGIRERMKIRSEIDKMNIKDL